LTTEGFIGLFISMFIVAVIPGPAVFSIVTTSMRGGFGRGFNMTLGLLLADFVFILLTISGLGVIAESIGPLFTIIKYLCAAYLIWMGVTLFFSDNEQNYQNKSVKASSDFFTGFTLTISNPKAIAFYIALFPAFINFSVITTLDILMIMVCAVFAFGAANLGYAYLGSKASEMINKPAKLSIIQKCAGTILTATGISIAVRA
jgi:threonine/homoserine/homoserine lactone efflux protein